jgi:hypothetical protein
MHAEGRNLSFAAVRDRSRGSLLGPALHRFGSWRKAIEAAGIDYATVERVREWSRETVLRELRARRDGGRELRGGAIQKEDLRLWAAAKRHFGSYQAALDAAGISVPKPADEWSWPASRLRAALRKLHEKESAGPAAQQPADPNHATIRLQLNGEAKHALDNLCDRRGMTQIAALSRLVRWLVGQDEIVQAWVLSLMSQEHLGAMSEIVLKRLAERDGK